MDIILVIIITAAMAYALGYRLGTRRGRLESRMKEFRRGYQAGYDRSSQECYNMLHPEDDAPANVAGEPRIKRGPGFVA